jgi:arylsulfatase A-like enzyme
MERRWRGVEHPPPVNNTQLTPEEHDAVRQNYSAMVENIDRWLGVYVEELEKRGELDNTLIVFSSDHGDMLGDHNQWGKSKPRHGSAGVPLVVWGPGVQRGVTCDLPMTNLDLAATFLDYAGLPVPEGMDSRSLRPLLVGETEQHREYVLSGLQSWRLVFDGRHKYVREADGGETLFDLEKDPQEKRDIAEDEPEVVARRAEMLNGNGSDLRGRRDACR